MAESNRNSARSFSETEEEFFQSGKVYEVEAVENFSDLDQGYRPSSFWRRLFRRAPR